MDLNTSLLKEEKDEETFQILEFESEIDDSGEINPKEKKFYPKTYYQGYNFLSKIFLVHITGYIIFIQTKIINKGLKVRIEHLPMLEEYEKIQPNFARASKSYENTQRKNSTFTRWDMVKLIFIGNSKWKVILIVFLYNLIDTVGKNSISVLIGLLIESIYAGNLKWSYIYGALISVVNLVALISRRNAL